MAVLGDGVEVEAGAVIAHEHLQALLAGLDVEGDRWGAVARRVGQGLAGGGDDDLGVAVGSPVADAHGVDGHAVTVLDLTGQVGEGVGHGGARRGAVGVEPGAQLALLGAGQAGHRLGLVGALADEGEGLEDGVVQVGGDVGALGLADLSGAGVGQGPVGPQPQGRQDHADARHERSSGDEPGDELVGGAVRGHPHEDADDGQAHPARDPQDSTQVAVRADEGVHLRPGHGRTGDDDDDDSHRPDPVQQPEAPGGQEQGRQEECTAVNDRLRQTQAGSAVGPAVCGASPAPEAGRQAGTGDRRGGILARRAVLPGEGRPQQGVEQGSRAAAEGEDDHGGTDVSHGDAQMEPQSCADAGDAGGPAHGGGLRRQVGRSRPQVVGHTAQRGTSPQLARGAPGV